MRRLQVWLVAVAAVSVAGCITSTTTVKIKPDGSGTVETATAVSALAAAQLKQMMAGFGGKEAGDAGGLFPESRLRAQAARMGDGVTFVSSRPIKTAEGEGVHAVYAFKDITKLRVNPTPSGPSGSEAMGLPGGGGPAAETLSFGFARKPNGNAVLTLLLPKEKAAEAAPGPRTKPPAAPAGPEQAQQLEMVKMLVKGMRIEVGLDVQGQIVSTNAPYVTGNHLTLLEMDFEQLLADPARLQAMQSIQSLAEAQAALKDVKGIKMVLDRDLHVEFR